VIQRRRAERLDFFLRGLGLDPNRFQAASATTALVDEALTHTSAALAHDHERLEFLGDAVLRLAASDHLRRHQPELAVGRWSSLRAQMVSDRWLAELAERCDLASVLRVGPMVLEDPGGRATVLAECCEALIGAIYEAAGGPRGGLEAVSVWLDPHWRQEVAELLADPLRHNWKSALQEWSQALARGLPRYESEERSRNHGDPRRFHCRVGLEGRLLGEGWGPSRRDAEQQAARQALEGLAAESPSPAGPFRPPPGSPAAG
jgi:ribonuclease-3